MTISSVIPAVCKQESKCSCRACPEGIPLGLDTVGVQFIEPEIYEHLSITAN